MLQNVGLTRRGLLMMGAGAAAQSVLRLYAFASSFWEKKEPAEWSSDEIDKLVTKSPWAEEVNAASSAVSRPCAGSAGSNPGVGGYPTGGAVSYPGGGGMGFPGS